MAKRSRGSSRPGQRPAHRPQRGPSRPASAATAPETSRPTGTLSEAEEARAAELEAEIVARERAADRGRRDRGKPAVDTAGPRGRTAQTSGLLAARAAEEYAYVVRDVRRIAVVGGGLLVVLLVIFVVKEVAHLF